MNELTFEELEKIAGARLTCADKWEIAGAIGGAIAGGWAGAAAGAGLGDFAANVFCS